MKKILSGIFFILLVAGCATRHPPIISTPSGLQYNCTPGEDCSVYPQPRLGPLHWDCWSPHTDCILVQSIEPSQLTSAGCLAHRVVTFGHKAQECKKTKNTKSK